MKSSDNRFEYFDKDLYPLPDNAPLSSVGRFGYVCRRDPSSHCSINCQNAGYQITNQNWKLTGTPDHPTITPSINCDGCWHGYIENGIFKSTSKVPENQQ